MKTKPTNSLTPSTDESPRLRELVREIGLPLAKLTDVTSLMPEECLKWWSNHGPTLPLGYKAFSRIAELVGLDENDLFSGNYDRDLARKRLLGDHTSLPARYQANQNSFLRTSAHIMRYIILTRGQYFADQILYSLNVSPIIYQNLNSKVNLIYFSDLLATLEKKGFSQAELDTLASVMFLHLKETTLGNSFGAGKSYFEIYKTLADNFSYFDTHFEYKSRFVGKKYVLKTTLPLEEHSLLKESPRNIQRLARYRHILSAWFPYLAGMSPLFPKTEFLRKPDSVEMLYEFDLSSSFSQSKKLFVV
jgi:hypothetical protein